MSVRHPRLITLLAALLATAAVAFPATAAAEIPLTNLLLNPSAEEGECATNTALIPHWTTSTGMSEFCYSSGRTLDPAAESVAGGQVGTAYFAGGTTEVSEASQTVDVSPYASDIDSGQISAGLSGWLGGFSTQEDNMKVTAAFYDGAEQPLGTPISIGPVSAADRNDESTLVPRFVEGPVPVGTRSIVVTMLATRFEGSDNDGAADLLRLSLNRPGPLVFTEEPTAVTPTSAVLHGLESPRNGTTSAFFQYGKTTSYGIYTDNQEFTDGSAHGIEAQIYGLEPGTTYHYRIIGEDAKGKRYGEDHAFTTPFAVAVPQLLSASTGSVGPHSATVLASVNPKGGGTAVQALSPASQFHGQVELPADAAVHAVEIPIANLNPGTTYHYYVAAVDSAGASYIGLPAPGTLTATTSSTQPGSVVLKPSGLQAVLSCLTRHNCVGSISVSFGRLPLIAPRKQRSRRAKLASGKFKLAGHRHGSVRLHWTEAGRRAAAHLKGRRVTETVIDRSVKGKPVTMTRVVKVK